MSTKLRIIWAALVIVIVITGAWLVIGGKKVPQQDAEQSVRAQVEAFGGSLNYVSLLAPTASADIARVYAPYASMELIAAWSADPEHAPGRLTSSPAPKRIEITNVTEVADDLYAVEGAVVYGASAGEDVRVPVSLALQKQGAAWRITRYEEHATPTTPTPARSEATIETSMGKGASALGVTITPKAIIEDSRCPANVQCIQAGTVRVRAEVVSALGTSMMEFTLGKAMTTEAESIVLTEVAPSRTTTSAITPESYRFTFIITDIPHPV